MDRSGVYFSFLLDMETKALRKESIFSMIIVITINITSEMKLKLGK